MCGIAAIFNYGLAEPASLEEVIQVREAMITRGPDDFGHWSSADGRMRLAHRRLAIIDPSEAGRQPMQSRDGTLAISFNGEIYNHRELRPELEARGFHFETACDTEVL